MYLLLKAKKHQFRLGNRTKRLSPPDSSLVRLYERVCQSSITTLTNRSFARGPPEMKDPSCFNIFQHFICTCTFYLKFSIEAADTGFSFWLLLFSCNFFLISLAWLLVKSNNLLCHANPFYFVMPNSMSEYSWLYELFQKLVVKIDYKLLQGIIFFSRCFTIF